MIKELVGNLPNLSFISLKNIQVNLALLDDNDAPISTAMMHKKPQMGGLLGKVTRSGIRHVLLEDVYLFNTKVY